jgi:Heavy-metal resistance
VKRWWLVIALLLSLGMNLGILAMIAVNRPEFVRQQQRALRPGAPGRLPQLADRLGLQGEVRERFLARQRQFNRETAGPRKRLQVIRQQVRAELVRAHPDEKRIDELLREAADLYLLLERSLTTDVLETRAMLPPEAERKYVDLIAQLQLEGPGALGRLPQPLRNRWWQLSRPAPPTQKQQPGSLPAKPPGASPTTPPAHPPPSKH